MKKLVLIVFSLSAFIQTVGANITAEQRVIIAKVIIKYGAYPLYRLTSDERVRAECERLAQVKPEQVARNWLIRLPLVEDRYMEQEAVVASRKTSSQDLLVRINNIVNRIVTSPEALFEKDSETLSLIAEYSMVEVNDTTALHVAAQTGWSNGVSLLLLFGADANATDSKGQIPIDVSSSDEIKEALQAHIVKNMEKIKDAAVKKHGNVINWLRHRQRG